MRSIVDCAICARLPQKSSSDQLPDGAAALVDGPDGTRRCPECDTLYNYNYEHDPGEPMVPATDTYTLVRLTPVLARPYRGEAVVTDRAAWDRLHATLVESIPRVSLPHLVRHVVESLTDYYLDNGDTTSFRHVLLESPRAVIRANAATDFLFVATEEHPVWTVRAFSRQQQRLASAWLDDPVFRPAILEALVTSLEADDEAVAVDATFGNRQVRVCDVAYLGLSNAFYRKLDPAPVMPALQRLSRSEDAGHRGLAERLLEDAKTSR